MSGDYSRNTFDPKKHFSGVLMQQGRVQLDADWNELVGIIDRRLRAETTDIIGRCVVPKETPEGFKIALSGSTLTIGPGRIYVHGLLAENQGKAPLEFDSVLAEERGTAPILYNEQPYLFSTMPVPLPPTSGGPHLVYLDVWQREVTYLEKPELIEKAVGVDTTARWQTVWQVRVLPNVGPGVTCTTPDDKIPSWLDLIHPSAGRLTTKAVDVPGDDNPCLIPPTGGYKGLENQLYRIEIHDKGAAGTATFKWSRDNATVATSVTAIPALDTLAVVRTGRDSILRFNIGDWVEITDDWHELAGLPGEMRKIQDVIDTTQTIILTKPLPAGLFPTGAQGQTDPVRHTRIHRWDQQKQVKDTNGNLLVDLDAPASTGVIPVPPAGTSIILENGVQITFDTDLVVDPLGRFRVGDYWVFAARTADASVEELQKAPPLGIHHHYGRLALVTFPSTPIDCRVLWPPDLTDTGCDCTVCVTVEAHNSGRQTIYDAIAQVREKGGTVCLEPGIYQLREEPILVTKARSVRLKGHGRETRLQYEGSVAAVVVEDSRDVTIEELALETSEAASQGIMLRQCEEVTVQRCAIQVESERPGNIAIGLAGYLLGTFIRENNLEASIGVGSLSEKAEEGKANYLFTSGLYVQENVIRCGEKGISLEDASFHSAEAWLSNNAINGCTQGGIIASGIAVAEARLNIQGNVLRVLGDGIIVGASLTQIINNDLSALREGRGGNGIVLGGDTNLYGRAIGGCQILGNRISGFSGRGIALRAPLLETLIKQNLMNSLGGGGIVMEERSSADGLSIENNQLLDIVRRPQDSNNSGVGIRLFKADHAEVANNQIRRVGSTAGQDISLVGIQVVASLSVQVVGNYVEEIGPAEKFVQEAIGIEILPPFDHVEVMGNTVRRSEKPSENLDNKSGWYALRIGSIARTPEETAIFKMDDGIILRASDLEVTPFEAGKYYFFGAHVYELPQSREVVTVRGNLLEAHGSALAVLIVTAGDCTFNDNRCRALLQSSQSIVEISATALIASANYARGNADIAMALHVDPKRCTILGNITSGQIRINNAVLGAPWAPFNIIAP